MKTASAEFEIRDSSIVYDPASYDVSLSRIKTHGDLLKWVIHLSEKSWVTTRLLRSFIVKVCDHKEWDKFGI